MKARTPDTQDHLRTISGFSSPRRGPQWAVTNFYGFLLSRISTVSQLYTNLENYHHPKLPIDKFAPRTVIQSEKIKYSSQRKRRGDSNNSSIKYSNFIKINLIWSIVILYFILLPSDLYQNWDISIWSERFLLISNLSWVAFLILFLHAGLYIFNICFKRRGGGNEIRLLSIGKTMPYQDFHESEQRKYCST